MKKRWIVLVLLGLLAAACDTGGDDGNLTLSFEAPDGSGFAGGLVMGVDAGPAKIVNFDLRQGVIVSGTVTDELGAPMQGVEVLFRSAEFAPVMDSAVTDVNGDYSVTVAADMWMADLNTGVPVLGTPTFSGLMVPPGGPFTQDFQLPATFMVTGAVSEEFGPGIANAVLEFTGQNTGALVSVLADGTGAYAANLIPDMYDVVVTPAGASLATHLKESFASNDLMGAGILDFDLLEGAIISGTVCDDFGNPLLATTDVLAVLGANSDFFAPPSVQTNPLDGTYTMGPLPPGLVDFQVFAPGTSGFPLQELTSNLMGSGPLAGVDLLLSPGYVLSGTIFQDDGITPEPNVLLDLLPMQGNWLPQEITTDGVGDYAVSLFPGDYEMLMTPGLGNLQLAELVPLAIGAGTLFSPTLLLGALVTGTVTDTGLPVPDVLVEIPGVPGATALTDLNGLYSFVSPPGSQTLELLAQNGQFADMALDPVSVAGLVAGTTHIEDVSSITSLLANSGPRLITGLVYEPDGSTRIAGVEITARNMQGTVVGRTVSDGSGLYFLVVQ